jgi:NTE family protein
MATNVRMSYDAFVPMMQQWRDDLVAYRCGMAQSRQQEIAARRPGWRCDEVESFVTRISFQALDKERAASLNDLPTRLRLPDKDVHRLIEAVRAAIPGNPVIRKFERESIEAR